MRWKARVLATKIAAFVFLAGLLVFLALSAQGHAAYGTITLDRTSGPAGTTVTITGTGWNDFIPGPLSSELYLTLLWVDHPPQLNTGMDNWRNQPGLYGIVDFQVDAQGNFVLTATIQSSWSGTGYFGIGSENPSTGYLRGIFADAQFKITSSGGSGGSGSSGQSLNAGVATYTGVAATGAAVALVVGQRIPLSRRKQFGVEQKTEREIDPLTEISYEKPPETFVQNLNPPKSDPEKVVQRGEVLRDWADAPDYIKQAWRNYDACKQTAELCESQIAKLQEAWNGVNKIHTVNKLKAMLKLGLKTTKIITDGLQMGMLQKLAAAREAALAKNALSQARMFGETISALENASKGMTEAEMAYDAAIQSTGKLKGLLADWNKRMSPDYVRPDNLRDALTGKPLNLAGRASDAREFDVARLETLDDATKQHLQPVINRFKQLLEGNYEGHSYDDALTTVLQNGVRDAAADMNAKEAALQTAQQTFQTALERASSVANQGASLSNTLATGQAIENVADVAHKGEIFGAEPDLEVDDPSKLAEGHFELERLQNQINWVKKHLDNARNCMDQNKEIIDGYAETQKPMSSAQTEQQRDDSSGGT